MSKKRLDRGFNNLVMYEMVLPYQRTRAQAKYRKERFELSFEEYVFLWQDEWHNRGKQSDQYCMTRIDNTKPWNIENTTIMLRSDQLSIHGKNRLNKNRETV